jgi:hypothetical protein
MVGWVRDSTLADAYILSKNLRDIDIEELEAASNTSPLDALLGGFGGKGTKTKTIINHDEVIGMFGVGDCPHLENYGVIWLLGSDGIDKVKRQFLRECRAYVEDLQKPYEVVYNWVHPANWKSLKWLQFCGFEIRDKRKLGIKNQEFYLMMREKSNV